MLASDVEAELRAAISRILQSRSQRKLIIAGPGTGKTSFFRTLLEASSGDQRSRLVLTFIKNLKADLERNLADLASVYTLHGYCQSLLHRHPALRGGLTSRFRCLPSLASLIMDDWTYLRDGPAPHFVDQMRDLSCGEDVAFYFERANYYDAVDFDDSVYRTLTELRKNPAPVKGYDLVLIDEYQDFNRMEAAVIDLLADSNQIVIAGDDDQALYSQLRGASWDHIRALYRREDYEFFPLPFCMRCPEVIVGAVNDVVSKARELKRLEGRIDKPYRHYEPVKGADSRRYPKIGLVMSSVQRQNANYFGRYIEEAIRAIAEEELKEAEEKGEPAALIIGSRQYLRQIEMHLAGVGYTIDTGRKRGMRLERAQGLEILAEDPESNLGWRVVLHFEKPLAAASCIRSSASRRSSLVGALPEKFKSAALEEALRWVKEHREKPEGRSPDEGVGPSIKLTSFEGAKGLSAQHVFIVGLHAGDLPRDVNNIADLEVCKFLVGLTRTKKKCSLLVTRQFAGKPKTPSPFLRWISGERYELTKITAQYWARAAEAK